MKINTMTLLLSQTAHSVFSGFKTPEQKNEFRDFFHNFFHFYKIGLIKRFFQVTKDFFQHWFQGKLVQLDFAGQQSSEHKMQKLNLHETES